MAQIPGFGAGILSQLRYNDDIHASAIELGHYLASYEVLYNKTGEDASAPSDARADRNRQVVITSIKRLIERYNLPIAGIFDLPGFDHGAQDSPMETVVTILEQIKKVTDSTNCAFLLIGQCVRFLCYAAACVGDDAIHGIHLQTTARGRLQEIEIRCVEFSVNCDALWEILVNEPPEKLSPLAIRKLLRELQSPLTILVVSADPQDQDYLRLSEERRELQLALRSTRFRDSFQVRDLPSCRIRDITQALDKYTPTVLHFSGHGDLKGLCFENDAHIAQIVNTNALANLFKGQNGLKLVILNACYSQPQAQCIADSIGYVIAMEGSIEDREAINFTREFYSALGHGRTFEAAFTRADAAIKLEATSKLKAHLLKGSPNNAPHSSPHQDAVEEPQHVDFARKVAPHSLLPYYLAFPLILILALYLGRSK